MFPWYATILNLVCCVNVWTVVTATSFYVNNDSRSTETVEVEVVEYVKNESGREIKHHDHELSYIRPVTIDLVLN